MKNKQSGFIDGLSMVILLASYMLIKIGADEIGKTQDGPHYTEKSIEQEFMDDADHKYYQLRDKKMGRYTIGDTEERKIP